MARRKLSDEEWEDFRDGCVSGALRLRRQAAGVGLRQVTKSIHHRWRVSDGDLGFLERGRKPRRTRRNEAICRAYLALEDEAP